MDFRKDEAPRGPSKGLQEKTQNRQANSFMLGADDTSREANIAALGHAAEAAYRVGQHALAKRLIAAMTLAIRHRPSAVQVSRDAAIWAAIHGDPFGCYFMAVGDADRARMMNRGA